MNNLSGRLVVYLVGIASIFVILFGIRETASILNPILLAVVITITVLPIPGRLTKKGIPGWLALVLTVLLVVLILGMVIFTIYFSVMRLSTQLPLYLAGAYQRMVAEFPYFLSNSQAGTQASPASIQFGPFIQQILLIIGNLLVQFGVALLIFFFMLSAAISLPGAARLGLNPGAPSIGRISALTEDVRSYMTILTGVNFAVGMGNTVLLWIVGVDYALLWGILAWFMGYIPSIGFLIALIPPLILAWAEFGLTKALVVLIGYVLINGGVQNFIQPKIMGQSLKISPVIVFVGLFVWGFLLGGIGAILAVPLTLLVITILENFEGTRLLTVLMRFTGEKQEPEHQEAVRHVHKLWEKAKRSIPLRKDS